MDSPASSTPPPPAQPPPDPDHVNLRITYLVLGNPRPPHFLANINLKTSVLELKQKIQAELPEHPPPTDQRLIYQGRPLLLNTATLRDVFRIEAGRELSHPYTIHIVIQDPQPTHQHQPPPHPAPNPHQAHLPPVPQVDFNNHEAATIGIQNSIAQIQQQLQANRADLNRIHNRIAQQNAPGDGLPNAGQRAANGQPIRHLPLPSFGMNVHNGLPVPPQQQVLLPGHPHAYVPQNPMVAPPSQNTSNAGAAAVQPPLQNPPFQSQPRMTVMTSTMNFVHPAQRPASAPGQRAETPSQPQANAPPHAPPTNIPSAAPVLPAINWPPIPLALPNFALGGPFTQHRFNHPQPTNTTAWLLSSPSGPQGFLFAPGHGYFSSTTPLAVPQQQQAGSTTEPPAQTGNANPIVAVPPGQPNHQGPNVPERAIIRADQPQPPAALAQVEQNGQDNDVFAFLINRGWLFLRLYVFMFVFSEPGTWKRWIMIVVAVIVCLQPRSGPFTRLLTAARRHFDNLVGPPAQPPRPDAAAQRQPNAAGQAHPARVQNETPAQRPANVLGAVQMTPEEAAQRIVTERRNQQQRQPRFWRDAFYRIEQSVALFLASLIPGVGERHVRAREDARREEQRREEEIRRAAEEAAAADSQNKAPEHSQAAGHGVQSASEKADVDVSEPGMQSASSSVLARDDQAGAGEVRNRTGLVEGST